MIGKVFGCGGAALMCRYNMKDSVKVGVGMMARAEVALITAQKGVDYGLISSDIMPFVIILIIVTSFMTPILLNTIFKKENAIAVAEV